MGNLRHLLAAISSLVWLAASVGSARAQSLGAPPAARTPSAAASTSIAPAPDYVIGVEDRLSIVFFEHKDMSIDVVVRPDGKISMPLLNDVQAERLTPEQLRRNIIAEAKRFIQEPNPTVIVQQINSRKVFIIGAVEKPGSYPLMSATTVLQLIATAGGLKETADAKKILIMREDAAGRVNLRFNYKEIVEAQRNLEQDIPLKPGDIIVVPGS